jgi:hypothetical protein
MSNTLTHNSKINHSFVNLIGKHINNWMVINISDIRKYDKFSYLCQCKCGNKNILTSTELTHDILKQCKKCSYDITSSKLRKNRPFEGCYKKLIWNANSRNISVSLTYDEYIEFTKIKLCHYCNRDIVWIEYRKWIHGWVGGHNLDRKDNALGYSTDNCVVCCPRCNRIKSDDISYNLILKIGNLIKEGNE